MKVIRNTAAAAALAAFAALSAGAQQQPAANRPAPATPAPAAGAAAAAVPDGKMAIIDSDAFGDQKAGIQRLTAAFATLDREFKPRRDELQTLKTRYDGLVKQVKDTEGVAKPEATAALVDQAAGLEKEMKRKQEDAQGAYQKRVQELTEPVFRDLSQALQNYARQRGITVVFDVSKLGNAMMVVNNAVDITDAFIADYNQRNPASTAAAAPAPSTPRR